MAKIRHMEILNFRSIKQFEWHPNTGVNCLIGPGDSGKSSILEAIDLCLSARRTVQICDSDFPRLDVSQPISISITIGELDDGLKSMETYGNFLRSYNHTTKQIDDEPEDGSETVLTLNLTVGSDLEPLWALVSERAQALGQSRNLTWADRVRICPTRIGIFADQNLSWRKGSVLNRLSDERADASAALVEAARQAREAFGDSAATQLGRTLDIVNQTAINLGIPLGGNVRALLDAHSVSFGGGTIALHNADGVPLRSLGIGSARLLVAGLQHQAAKETSIILVDELEYGLEPHRIIRLLGSIGAKETPPPLQAFVTTHSPVALRELSGNQLYVVRANTGVHEATLVGVEDDIQGTIRTYPDAFLAPSVLVCEGASEVGLMKGLDLYWVAQNYPSLTAKGIALVDAGGCSKIYGRANALQKLQYRTAVLRDDDVQPDATAEGQFTTLGGFLFKWEPGRALEEELFLCLPDEAVIQLLQYAIELHGDINVNSAIMSESSGTVGLKECLASQSLTNRVLLGKVACKKNSWFKTVSRMEHVGLNIIGPLATPGTTLHNTLSAFWAWSNA